MSLERKVALPVSQGIFNELQRTSKSKNSVVFKVIQIIFNNKMTGSIFQKLVIVLEDLKTAMTRTSLLTSIFYWKWFVVGAHSCRLGKKLVLPIVVLGSPSVGFD